MGRIVRCEFAGAAATAKDPTYPVIPARGKPRSETGIKSTLAADYRLAVTALRSAAESAESKPWKMRKFAGVKSKINRLGEPAGSAAEPSTA